MRRIITLLLLTLTMASVNAMPYESARREAMFMTDKMALELGLNTLQYEAVYEINLDYLLTLSGNSGYYGTSWRRRNHDLQYVLTAAQYNRFMGIGYFYRPVTWRTNHMALVIYDRYANTTLYYYSSPKSYDTYRGGRTANRYYYRGRNYTTPNTPPRTDMGRYTRTTGTSNHGTWRDNSNNNRPGNTRGNTRSTRPSTNTRGNTPSKSGTWRK